MNCIIIRNFYPLNGPGIPNLTVRPNADIWLFGRKGIELRHACVMCGENGLPGAVNILTYSHKAIDMSIERTPDGGFRTIPWSELINNGYTHWAYYYPLSIKDREEAIEDIEFTFGEEEGADED